MARARGVDLAALADADTQFAGSALVSVAFSFKALALYGDMLEHRIAPPVFGQGRSFRPRLVGDPA